MCCELQHPPWREMDVVTEWAWLEDPKRKSHRLRKREKESGQFKGSGFERLWDKRVSGSEEMLTQEA